MRLFRWIVRLIGGIFADVLMFFVNIWLWLISKVMRIAVIAQGKNPDEDVVAKLQRLISLCLASEASVNEYANNPEIAKMKEFIHSRSRAMQSDGKIGVIRKSDLKSKNKTVNDGIEEWNAQIKSMLESMSKVKGDIKVPNSSILTNQIEINKGKNKEGQNDNMVDAMGSAWPPESIKHAANSIRDFEDARILEELDKATDELINKTASKPSKKKSKKTSNKSKARRTSKSRKSPKKRSQ